MLTRSRSSVLAIMLLAACASAAAAAPVERSRPPESTPAASAPDTGYFIVELSRGYHVATLRETLRAPVFDSTRRDSAALRVTFEIRAFEVMDVQLLNDGRIVGGTLRFGAAEAKRVERTLVSPTSSVSFRYRFAGEIDWHESPIYPAIDEYRFTISRNGVLAHLNSP